MFNTTLVDFDGTICHTHRAISKCLIKTLAQFSVSVSKIDELIGRGVDLKKTIQLLTGESEENVGKLIFAISFLLQFRTWSEGKSSFRRG